MKSLKDSTNQDDQFFGVVSLIETEISLHLKNPVGTIEAYYACSCVITVDAFIQCEIFKNPEELK